MNTIVMLLDSLRADHLGCFGNHWIKTPNIDRLAEESIVFDNAYSEGLPTLPFRNAAFTGKYTLTRKGWAALSAEDQLLSEVLWSKGYTSALVSDTEHMHRFPHSNFARGFDYVEWIRGNEGDAYRTEPNIKINFDFFEHEKSTRDRKVRPGNYLKERYRRYLRNISEWTEDWWENDENRFVSRVMKAAMGWLERQKRRDNLFLWIDSFDPHEPYDPTKEFQSLYPVPNYSGPPMCWFGGYADVLSDAEVSHIRALYAAMVSMCDKWVGIFLDKLKQLDMMDNTMIIFLSDHGEWIGERGLFLKEESWPYEELSRIPLIIRHPEGLGRGQRHSAFVDTTDIMPTILDFLQVIGPRAREVTFKGSRVYPAAGTDDIEGYSLIPLICGEQERIREFSISGWHDISWRIRDNQWSFYMWAPKEKSRRDGPELYRIDHGYQVPAPTAFDREKDWMERVNVIDRHPEVAEKLELELHRFLRKYAPVAPGASLNLNA
jgi:arylsulfatase A-like enzyme